MKSWLIAMAMGLALAQGAWAKPQDAQALVKSTADEVLSILKERKQEFEADPRKVYDLVDRIVLPHFDFERISKRALGRNWKKADAGQRDRFVKEFKTLLVRTYAKALTEYTDQVLNYLPLEADTDATQVTVRSEVEQPGSFPIPIDYSLQLKEGAWKVYDVEIDGISLVANYRATFASEVNKSGLDSLITQLAKRNAQARDD